MIGATIRDCETLKFESAKLLVRSHAGTKKYPCSNRNTLNATTKEFHTRSYLSLVVLVKTRGSTEITIVLVAYTQMQLFIGKILISCAL